jgi:hypothetical protein
MNAGYRVSGIGYRVSKVRYSDTPYPIPYTLYPAFIVFLFILQTSSFILPAQAQNVGIGTATPGPSALLQLETTSKGFLIPRMTDAQMQAISTPATGDLVYNTTYTNFYCYNGTIWTPIAGGNNWSLTGNSSTSPTTNFLGTIDAQDLVQKTNSNERMRFYNGGNVGLTNVTGVAEAIRFYERSGSGSLYTGFMAGVQTSTVHYILPPADGLPNQALVTDGAGNLSWHTFTTFGGSGSQSIWKRGSAAGGEYSDSSSNSDSGPYSIVAGHSNSVSGNYEDIFGSGNSGSGSYGALHGGVSNTSSGDHDVLAGGQSNHTSATGVYIGGGKSNTTSGNEEVVLGGSGGSFSGTNSTILGGLNNSASSNNELIYGSNVTVGGGSGFVVFKMGTHTKMGIGTTSPTEFLDIVGNLKFSGSLKPNGSAGTSGKYLLSAGAGAPPTWGTITIPTTNWSLTGTSGSNPATNFLGTSDAQDLAIRTKAIERMRVTSAGLIGIGTSTPAHQLSVLTTGTSDETAAIYGAASGTTSSQAIAIWGRADNSSTSNTGTISTLATGNGNTTAGTTNVALQISQGEFAMGRTTQAASAGSIVEGATTGTLYSTQGPSGVIQLSLVTDLMSAAPVAGTYQDMGTVIINNPYITANSIIIASIVAKTNGGGTPDPKNSVYRVDVESRTAGSCVLRIGMIPFVSDVNTYQGLDYIRVAYAVINPGR